MSDVRPWLIGAKLENAGPKAHNRSATSYTLFPLITINSDTTMIKSNRRVFLMQVATASGAIALAGTAQAQAMVVETDAQAAALGYKADATKVDKTKFPKFAAGQNCANCTLYQGKAGAAAGVCPIFAGKQVAAKGWCNSYVKKA